MDAKPACAALASLFLALALASAAAARAPSPVRPVSTALYAGRWYEIARTPNANQRDCQGAASDFSGFAAGAFSLVETCHKGSPTGPAHTIRAKGRVVPDGAGNRFRVGFFGGLITQEFWIIDHADDGAWAIMGTPGGNFVWLLARRPALPAEVQALALGRLRGLGYRVDRLIYPRQAAS